jgi:hypothetical protein
MARPSRLTPALIGRIAAAVRRGVYADVAAVAAGVSARTFARWIARGKSATRGIHRELFDALYQAESSAEVEATLRLRKSAGRDVRATLSLLQRRYPERWSPNRPPQEDAAAAEQGSRGGVVIMDLNPTGCVARGDADVRPPKDGQEKAS